jgi:Na+/H+ antiporter NhaD/arsenite permease-like protein
VWSAQKGRAQPWAILVMLSVVTALVSALLDNVTTVLLIAPVTLDIARHLETPPYPFLFAEVFASNIGGTATLIGDPPNIIIGSAAQLSFNDFAVNLTPAIIAVMAAQLVATHLIWGRKMSASAEARARIMALDRDQLIVDPKLMRSSLFVIGGVIAAFVFAGQLRLQPGTIALFGAAILMLLHNSNITGRATSRRSESPRHSTRSIGSRSSFSSGCSSSSTASMSPACSTWPHSA